MLYSPKDYVWPSRCPRCDRRMTLLDKLSRAATTLGSLVNLLSGKPLNRRSDPRKCDFCGSSSGRARR